MNNSVDLLKKEIASKKAQIADLERLLKLDLQALAVYTGVPPKVKRQKRVARVPKAKKNEKKSTLADKMESVLLSLDKPLTSSQFFTAINNRFPASNLTSTSWSPQLSMIYRNPAKPFKRKEYPNNPFETRFYYGLKKWFVNEQLRPEYSKKIGVASAQTEFAADLL